MRVPAGPSWASVSVPTGGRRTLVVAASAAAVVVGLGWLLFFSPAFAVRAVEVVGADQVAERAVVAAAGVAEGTPLLRVDGRRVARGVETLAPVARVSVERIWPSTVRITVTERRPVAQVRTGGQYGLVGTDGEVYRYLDQPVERLPLLAGAADPSDPAEEAARAVATALPPRWTKRVDRIEAATADDVLLRLRGGAVVRWGSASQTSAKLTVLTVLMAQRAAEVYDVSVPDAPAVVR